MVFDDKVDIYEISKIVEIATYYYEEDYDQKSIAEKMHLSQSEVSRILKIAKQNKMIKIEVSPNFDTKLSTTLKEKFPHLKEVIISYLTYSEGEDSDSLLSKIGYEGAKYFIKKIEHTDSIGLTCGRTLNSFITSLGRIKKESATTFPEKCKVYALIHPGIEEIVDVTSSALVASLVRLLPKSRGIAYHFPKKENLLNEVYKVKETFEKKLIEEMSKLKYYFIGIGYIDYTDSKNTSVGWQFNNLVSSLELGNKLEDLGAAGESNHQPFNERGELLINRDELLPLRNDLNIYLPLEVLQNHIKNDSATVVAMAGGGIKHKAIYSALKAKIFNILVTDSLTALKLIEFEANKNI